VRKGGELEGVEVCVGGGDWWVRREGVIWQVRKGVGNLAGA
jgi:hypothetical protein